MYISDQITVNDVVLMNRILIFKYNKILKLKQFIVSFF